MTLALQWIACGALLLTSAILFRKSAIYQMRGMRFDSIDCDSAALLFLIIGVGIRP